VGNIVLCRVVRITPRQAVVVILVCGETVLEAEWQGVIRVQDVRATEKDRVKIYESFRPGDVVRAEVVRTFPLLYVVEDHVLLLPYPVFVLSSLVLPSLTLDLLHFEVNSLCAAR